MTHIHAHFCHGSSQATSQQDPWTVCNVQYNRMCIALFYKYKKCIVIWDFGQQELSYMALGISIWNFSIALVGVIWHKSVYDQLQYKVMFVFKGNKIKVTKKYHKRILKEGIDWTWDIVRYFWYLFLSESIENWKCIISKYVTSSWYLSFWPFLKLEHSWSLYERYGWNV